MPTTSSILLKWIQISQNRGSHELTKILWFARDMSDGITVHDDPYYVTAMLPRITTAFDAMDQSSAELQQVRKELGL